MSKTITTQISKPLLRVTETSRPFWEGANASELVIQRCASPACGKAVFYPRVCCPFCQGPTLNWFHASGKGRIISHTTIYRTHHSGFDNEVPYVFAAVELIEGPCIYAQIPGASTDGRSLTDQPVMVDFIDHVSGTKMPVFRLTNQSLNNVGGEAR